MWRIIIYPCTRLLPLKPIMFSAPSDLFLLIHDSQKNLLGGKSILRLASAAGFVCAVWCGRVDELCYVTGSHLELMVVQTDTCRCFRDGLDAIH